MKYAVAILLMILSGVVACGYKDNDNNTNNTLDYPPESAHHYAYTRLLKPPSGWTSGVAWMQAVHNRASSDSSSVAVDWIRFYCRIAGSDVLLAGDSVAWAGLWLRDPWFGNNNQHENISVNSNLPVVFNVSERPDKVWHWGGEPPNISAGAERCWMEAQVRTSGHVWVQAGVDFWISNTATWCGLDRCNTEAGVSNWYYGAGTWVISVNKP